jgi:hypothetical protein
MTHDTHRVIALDELHQNLQANSWRKTIAILLLMFVTVFPAMTLTGFDQLLPQISLPAWLVISATGGAFAGLIFYPEMKYCFIGLVCGALAGPAALLATILYLMGRRDGFWDVEVLIPLFLGVAPVFLLYYLLMRLAVTRAADWEEASRTAEE